jgi:hypothetical protein
LKDTKTRRKIQFVSANTLNRIGFSGSVVATSLNHGHELSPMDVPLHEEEITLFDFFP